MSNSIELVDNWTVVDFMGFESGGDGDAVVVLLIVKLKTRTDSSLVVIKSRRMRRAELGNFGGKLEGQTHTSWRLH